MNHNRIRKRLTAVLLSAVLLCSAILPVFAWNPNAGTKCGSKIGAQYLSSDGRNYMDVPDDYYFLKYDADGSTSFVFKEGRYKVRRHLLLVDPGTKEEKWAYCIEAGIDYDVSSNGYLSENADNSKYFLLLPYSAQQGIMMTVMYGYQEGKAIPIAGLNADDAFFAGQVLIWEYQQGIRTDAGARKDNGKVKADTYYNLLKGRPAEKMYNYLLEKIRTHSVIPSFASRNKNQAPSYTLEYNSQTGKYSTTLTDSNNSGENLQQLTKYGLTVTRSGNQYTITADKPIDTAVCAEFRKDIPVGTEKLLIWGRPGYQTVCTGADDPVTFYLNIRTESFGGLKLKKTSEDGKVSGIPFRIQGNGVDQTVKTNSSGEFLLDELRAGVYTITEQTGDPYEPQESQRVTIVPGRTTTLTFHNTLKRGDLKVAKDSEDGLNSGIRFRLSGTALNGAAVELYAETDGKGVALFEDVPVSRSQYVLEEVDTGIQYVVPAKQNITVRWNEVTNAKFENILKKWRATVTKSDSETGTTQGDASLAGAVYGIYKGNQLVDRYTTDECSQFVTDWYPCGNDWTVKEIQPSEGYLLDPTVHKVGAEPGSFTIERNEIGMDVNEQAVKGKVSIIKHNDDGSTGIETPEMGAEFQIYLKSAGSYDKAKETERDTLVCDENGYAESKLLPYGKYTVHQTKGRDGRELMDDFDVFVNEDGKVYRYLINNAVFKSLIRIEKRDEETGKIIPVSGFGFQIRNKDTGELVVQHINYPTPTELDTFYTDSTGMLMLPEPLDYGNYELLEVCTGGEGYVLSPDPVPFKVDGTETVVTVTKYNMAQKGKILIHKTGEVFSSVKEENGFFQPVYSMQGLNGTVYEITAKEDVVTPDGTIRYKKGTIVDTVTTRNGYAQSKPLYLGSYLVTEKTAGSGMILNPEPHEVTLQYAGETVEITVAETAFVNERQKVKVDLKKSLEQDEIFGIGRNDEITNVSFGLYADEDITAADGSKILKDGLIEIAFADEKEEINFTSDLPFGKYYVKEYTTDSHYQISEQKYPFEFEYAGQKISTVYISVNNGKPVENKLIRGNIHGKKVAGDGFSIAGAVFGLFAKDETEFTEETALLTAKSNEIGVFGFFDVPYGEYLVRELSCPPAFVLSEEIIPVTVSEQDQIVEITMENRFITGSVQVFKQDSETSAPISDIVFQVYADVDRNKAFDPEIDRLAGELTETEAGIYQLDGLRYGGYFLREETAGEAYVKDDSCYYFSIETDGETVTVGNNGEIFVNKPVLGCVLIRKTDSETGEALSGAVFGLFDADGKEIRRGETDETGLLLFENLRYGKYVLKELKAKDGYQLNAETVNVEITEDGQLVEISLANIRTPPVPDIPKTGENIPWFWISALVISGSSMLVSAIVIYCTKKK